MKTQKCYKASFNIGNVEVWSSELFLDKESIFMEIEDFKDEIIERIECFSFLDEEEICDILKSAILDLKKYETYTDKSNNFDFFILEKPILKNYKQKNYI
ncbi:MAG: hypothetical protein LBE36_02945 [Flavobacteriaceae bacterium]|jgi:hypothetical protein|nr:hypothetical protein [Flavobacteriaceae bacterium]